MAPITNVELLAIASKRWSQTVDANLTRVNGSKPASAAIHIRVPKLSLRLREVNDPFNETYNPHKHSTDTTGQDRDEQHRQSFLSVPKNELMDPEKAEKNTA